MKRIIIIPLAFIIVLILLVSCATDDNPSPDQSNQLIKAPYKGFGLLDDGALVHLVSGAVYEKEYGDFLMLTPEQADRMGLENVTVYDKFGNDVSVQYMMFSSLVLATIYVYPCSLGETAAEMLDVEYRKCLKEVFAFKNVAEYVYDGAIELSDHKGHMGIIKTIEGEMPAISFIFLYEKNKWFVLFRVTVFERFATEETLDKIIEFSKSFDIEIIK